MNDIETRYKTEATTFGRLMIETQGVGFKVPEYQRIYDWGEEHLNRLIDDCLDGLYQLYQIKNNTRIPYTFLGTIILVKEEKSKEPHFNGTSLALVDGQQRVTSLVLLCCALYEKLNIFKNSIIYSGLHNSPDYIEERYIDEIDLNNSIICNGLQNTHDYIKDWLIDEIDHFSNNLFKCAVGTLEMMHSESTYFPRIIRSSDSRGHQTHSEYRSSISNFLMSFNKYVKSQASSSFSPRPPKIGNGNSTEFQSLLGCYKKN